MNPEEIRTYCLSLSPSVTEDFPFDENTLTFRIGNKIFALLALDAAPASVNLKCEPEKAVKLREMYDNIIPGYHMNKKHWNTVKDTESMDPALLKELIANSYLLVVSSLPKKIKEEL